MFLLIFYSVNCLTTSQINLMTLLGVPTPRFGTSEPLKSSNQISLSCSCCATSLNWCVSKVCHRLHRKSSLCRCVWKPAFVCLHVFFVSVSGSGTNKWAGDLCLTPRAKICFACWLFLLSSFASSNFFFFSILPMFSSFMSLFVYIHSGNHRLRKMQPGTRLFSPFLRPFLPLFSSLKCRQSGMLGVSKLASVLGVPGEQPRHNSRVEWAGERMGGKMNSVLWGFPNPNSLQGLCRLHCAEFTRIYLSWQTIQHVMKDKGWKMFCGLLTLMLGEKYCGQACNTVNFQKRSCLNLGCLCFIAAFLVQSLIQLSPIFHNSSSPCFLFFQRQRWTESVLMYRCICWMMECLWYVCMSLPMHVCTYVRVCASLPIAACGFSCRGVDHDTAVNLKGKLINWSTGDSSTSSPQNGLCSLTLGKSCHVLRRGGIRQLSDGAQRRREKKKKKRPPISDPSSGTPPIPSSHRLWVYVKGREEW